MGQVSLRGIRKSFGDLEIIRGVDLDVQDGDAARSRIGRCRQPDPGRQELTPRGLPGIAVLHRQSWHGRRA